MLTAHYFKGSKGAKWLYLCHGVALSGQFESMQVSGIREARQIAAERGAKCWNF